jgi:CHAT domain-containing protein
VRVVPSATWYCSHPQRLAVKPVTILAVGDPAFNRQLFSSLSPLRQAGPEAMEIASLYACPTVLTASSATPGQFLRAAGKADVIHFAGHAFTDSCDPLLILLVLSSQGLDASCLLYAKDILRMRLRRSPSIVLSACATAGGAAYGRGISNVAFAFLAAGANTVVAATAPVSDEDTFFLLRDYHRRVAAGQSPESALREAQLSMLDRSESGGDDISRWGLFEVIG